MNKQEILEKFNNFAVVGVTADENKYGYKIFKRLLNLGYATIGISPKYDEVLGNKMYKHLEDIDTLIDVVVFVVKPKYAYDYINEMRNIGIKYAWMQPGTYDDELIEYMHTIGIEPIQACILEETKDKAKHLC